MLRGGANGADLGPVPRMHALTGHADKLGVYTPAAVASQVDGRPFEGPGFRRLHEGEHVGYVRTHKRRELVRAGKAPVRCLRIDHLDQGGAHVVRSTRSEWKRLRSSPASRRLAPPCRPTSAGHARLRRPRADKRRAYSSAPLLLSWSNDRRIHYAPTQA